MRVNLPVLAGAGLLVRFAVGFIFATAATMAAAADFTVSPVRIFMAPDDRAVALTITNEGSEPLVMQADLYDWRQNVESGEDELELTEDLFL